jgi:hypothetical protein
MSLLDRASTTAVAASLLEGAVGIEHTSLLIGECCSMVVAMMVILAHSWVFHPQTEGTGGYLDSWIYGLPHLHWYGGWPALHRAAEMQGANPSRSLQWWEERNRVNGLCTRCAARRPSPFSRQFQTTIVFQRATCTQRPSPIPPNPISSGCIPPASSHPILQNPLPQALHSPVIWGP